jgi:hypothetical protein
MTDATPEQVAQWFHESYEALAPQYSYETRKASAIPWEQVPQNNRELMIETARAVLERIRSADASLGGG